MPDQVTPRRLRVLNFGAGVQSTAVALMSARGELPSFETAVFADTGGESAAVYAHLDWLIRELDFPVLVRSYGKRGDDLITGRGAIDEALRTDAACNRGLRKAIYLHSSCVPLDRANIDIAQECDGMCGV